MFRREDPFAAIAGDATHAHSVGGVIFQQPKIAIAIKHSTRRRPRLARASKLSDRRAVSLARNVVVQTIHNRKLQRGRRCSALDATSSS